MLFNYNKTAASYSDFPDMPGNYFWSSSTNVGETSWNTSSFTTDAAWFVNFYDGNVLVYGKSEWYAVRCVR